MNKRKGFLDEAKINKNIDCKACNLLNILMDYFEIVDLDCGTVHGKIFYMLYLSEEQFSYEIISEKIFVSISTIKRYRIRYEELAQKIVKNGLNERRVH